jgi:hypothetical protein
LFRIGIGRRLSDLCLTLDRWAYEDGRWRLAETLEEVWASVDAPEVFGEARARLSAHAEHLEELADDERLADGCEHRLAVLRVEQQGAENGAARGLARELTRDPR